MQNDSKDKYILDNYLNKNGHPNGAKIYHMKKFHPDDYQYIVNRFPDSESIKETIYRIKHGLEERPKCPVCGKAITFRDSEFKKHCSAKCSANDKVTREKCRQTCQEKYGVNYVSQASEIIDKIKATNLEKYGETSYTKTKEYKDRTAQTNLNKYGVKYASQAKVVKDKIKKTNLEKYGVEYISQSDLIKEKVKQTSLARYRVPCTFQSESSLEKIRKTNLEKYGVEYISQSDLVKEKVKQTCINKYGSVSYLSSDECRNKLHTVSLNRYGTYWPQQSESFKAIARETMKKNHTYGTSKHEEYIYEKLITKFDEVIRQYSSDKYPYPCDFFIPAQNLYIEYQGTWTHGRHPYNPISKEDTETLVKWKSLYESGHSYYSNAINTWTVKDLTKRKLAKENNLNWIEFWNLNEFNNWFVKL